VDGAKRILTPSPASEPRHVTTKKVLGDQTEGREVLGKGFLKTVRSKKTGVKKTSKGGLILDSTRYERRVIIGEGGAFIKESPGGPGHLGRAVPVITKGKTIRLVYRLKILSEARLMLLLTFYVKHCSFKREASSGGSPIRGVGYFDGPGKEGALVLRPRPLGSHQIKAFDRGVVLKKSGTLCQVWGSGGLSAGLVF